MDGRIDTKALCQRWVHSHEEDTPAEMVYRPATFKFPRSRGRSSFELNPDGSLVESRIGESDAPLEVRGTWVMQKGADLAFYDASQTQPTRVLRISSVGKDRLVISKK